jgi:WXG100 family type VII secretion target
MSAPPVTHTTGGMNGYKVLPADVAAAAQNCDSTAQEVYVQLQALKSYVMDLESQWLGVASQTFNNLMTDWDIYANMLNQALTGIGDGLRGNWTNYTTSEETAISNLKQVNGSLPSAPVVR